MTQGDSKRDVEKNGTVPNENMWRNESKWLCENWRDFAHKKRDEKCGM